MVNSSFAVLPYIVASIAYFAVGAIWYTPLFGKAWAKEVGRDMGGSMEGKWGQFVGGMIGQLVSSFLFAAGVYLVIMVGGWYGLGGALKAWASASAFFVLSVNSGKLFFQGRPRLFLIDAGYGIVGALVIALILGFWR